MMKKLDLSMLLRSNSYPGRGIVLGRSTDGAKAMVAYFIMGRSVNSRNRVFKDTEDGIRTQAFDESKMTDPSLIIYHPVRLCGERLIVTNGDQTDTIRDFLQKGLSMEEALRTREFEPDGPNWTPRISGLVERDGSYRLSILKSADAEGSGCLRQTFEYPGQPGVAHLIHTYQSNGDPLPSFSGEPVPVSVPTDDVHALARQLWESLNADNKVSLYVAAMELSTGHIESVIINRNQEV